MDIGIIGSGHIGGTLARRFVEVGHNVGISNRHGPESLRSFAEELGARACPMPIEEAERFGELVVVAIPFGQYATVAPEPLVGKIVIDAENYYPKRDGDFPEIDRDVVTSSGLLQEHLRGATVVKAFNAIRWDTLADEGLPAGSPGRLAIPLAGDDVAAKQVVAALIDHIGFDPFDVGLLADSGRIQPGSPVYVAHLTVHELSRRLAA